MTAEGTSGPLWDSIRTRFVLFTGKGGVGKTTAACALAVALADEGRSVLIVSTDPASNLSGVFSAEVASTPTPVPGILGLDAMDIDPQAAADAYRERVLTPLRGAVPPEELASIAEQLAGQCTVEVASFDEFSTLLAAPRLTQRYDHVVFDTAPTGHTLRLLELPAAWSSYIEVNPGGTGCLGPLSALGDKQQLYRDTVDALGDPERTTVVLVTRPEPAALREAARAGAELGAQGVSNQRLLVNGVLEHPLSGDAVAESFAQDQRAALEVLPAPVAALPRHSIPLVPYDVTGLGSLRALTGRGPAPSPASTEAVGDVELPDLATLVSELSSAGPGVTLVMGKGGVGKTTVAAALAAALGRGGHPTHLASTDPAGQLPDGSTNVSTSWIDPDAAEGDYVAAKLAAAGDLDPEHRRLLEEELRSPCTQELAVFVEFSRLLRRGRHEQVIIDTAPTGHTLLLLDQTGAYHRDVMRTAPAGGRMTTPFMQLQDPSFARVLIVTLAQTTPVQEASELQDDLRRAGIEPYGWVVNASLAATDTQDPVLRHRAALEHGHLRRIAALASRTWVVPWRTGPSA